MNSRYFSRTLIPLTIALALAGCSGDEGYSDLDDFMADARDTPRGEVEPLPEFEAYEAFTYAAADRRSPFDPPAEVELALEEEDEEPESDIEPDKDRPSEPLERFAVGDLAMVGTLQRDDEGLLYALISDNQGGIHRVTVGNYMGENYGRVEQVTDSQIVLREIVSDGRGGWVKRPRTISLQE